MTCWDHEVVARVQGLLDSSLAAAGEVQRSFFGKPERRLAASEFLATWNSIYMCAATTAGESGWPHVAAIKLEFDADANLPMLVYLGGARERDLRHNPRVGLQKHKDDGTVMTVYGLAAITDEMPVTDQRGRRHIRVLIRPVRAYAIGPYVTGPLASR
jgi:Pyridoxamine 5'-phosphate oxidase